MIKDAAVELNDLIGTIDETHGNKGSRYTSLSKTALEESVFWAVKELTA